MARLSGDHQRRRRALAKRVVEVDASIQRGAELIDGVEGAARGGIVELLGLLSRVQHERIGRWVVQLQGARLVREGLCFWC